MKKKILLPILLIIFSLLLVSCIEISTNKGESYKSNNVYENKIIDSINSTENQTVSIIDDNQPSRPGLTLGSATIIKKVSGITESTYYALTTSDIITSSKLNIYIPNNRTEKITGYAINEKTGIAIIKFNSRIDLNEAKFENDNKPESISVGQTVLSTGLDIINSYPVTTKEGVVTNLDVTIDSNDNYFTHDISNNAGEIGTGVYSLSGTLIGLNVKKVWYDYNKSTEENILGLNYALKISSIFTLLKNITEIDFTTNIINDSLIKEKNEFSNYQMDSYELEINNLYNDKNNSVVEIDNSSYIRSGIIINKTGNSYDILTINDETEIKSDLSIKTYKGIYRAKSIQSVSELLSLVTFESNVNYNVENIKETNFLTRGQTVLTIGSVNDNLFNSLSVGNLSKPNSEYIDYFMHSSKTNESQIGGPIYNLNGNLIGLHIGKINSIATQTGEIAGEGLSYGIKIETIIKDLNKEVDFKEYKSNNDYEKTVIDVTANVLNKTVTVKTDKGHGSGVLFRRDKNSDGSFLYSVLTNQHVVGSSNALTIRDEISVSFNNDLKSIRIKDVYVNKNYDLAILRFNSFLNIEVVDSKAMNNNIAENPTIGQVVIAIGTPEDVNRDGYVTTGLFTAGPNNYQGQSKLGLLHSSPLNPGNSGGPLFNLKGELIGLNVAKATFFPTKEGQVFIERISITLNINKIASLYNSSISDSLYIKTKEHKPKIGITVIEINNFLEEYGHLSNLIPKFEKGIVIAGVDDLYDAYGKLLQYDVITHINGIEIKENQDVAEIVADQTFGFKLVITVLRLGVEGPIDIEVVLSW